MRTEKYNLSISLSNRKLGPIPNWSLQAPRTCPKDLPCYKTCYAQKGNHLFPAVQEARIINTDFVMECDRRGDYVPFENEIQSFLDSNDMIVNLFRIHESGDFFSKAYAEAWFRIIQRNPKIKFMAFTKAFSILRQVPFHELSNCSIRLSAWIGMDIPQDLKNIYPVAWFKDKAGVETRIPDDAFICPGNKGTCFKCRYCWKKEGCKDTVLKEH